MDTPNKPSQNRTEIQEILLKPAGGMGALVANTLLLLAALAATILGVIWLDGGRVAAGAAMLAPGLVYLCLVGPVFYMGLKVLHPNEAMALTLFGRYIGTVKAAGFYYVNPFCGVASSPPVPASGSSLAAAKGTDSQNSAEAAAKAAKAAKAARRISLKAMTLNNDRQKINDKMGNPVMIGIVVIWRVANTAKALFSVDNYVEFLSIQCDAALRDIVRLYPYDAADDDEGGEKSLRGSSQEIAGKLREEIQRKVEMAGLEVSEARITHLAYAPEIAAVMLQRQQASAIVDARQLIVEGAVGMVEMALEKLKGRSVVELDDERKAAMVSNLMVVLCGNRDAQPIVNSGSLY
jgi:regulator of protease activity HflC (stomatin/prohibitin superfamily)